MKYKIEYLGDTAVEEVEADNLKDSADGDWIDFYNLSSGPRFNENVVLRVRAARVLRIARQSPST